MKTQPRIISAITITSLLLSGTSTLTGCKGQSLNIGPSTGEVVGVIVGVTAAVTVTTVVLVNKSHHSIKGCVSTGTNGLQLESESDKKMYLLLNPSPNIKPGEVVKVHGNKGKKPKDSQGTRDFTVEKMNKDYGPCKLHSATTGSSNGTP